MCYEVLLWHTLKTEKKIIGKTMTKKEKTHNVMFRMIQSPHLHEVRVLKTESLPWSEWATRFVEQTMGLNWYIPQVIINKITISFVIR